MPKILASHENIGVCLKSWCLMKILVYAKILASHENLGGYTKYRHLVKIWAYNGTLAGVKISKPCKNLRA